MKNLFLSSLFSKYFSCAHRKALEDSFEGYCPECGVYLKKIFYIVRCKHCEIKREAQMRFEKIFPVEKFCTNCGGQEFYVERLEKISFTDIHFAIHTKEASVVGETKQATQVWVEVPKGTKKPQLRLVMNGSNN